MIEIVCAEDGSHEGPVWLDLCAPTREELDRIAFECGIPRAALDECTAPRQLPKHERLNGTTFLIARVYDEESRLDVEIVPDDDELLASIDAQQLGHERLECGRVALGHDATMNATGLDIQCAQQMAHAATQS